MTRKYKGKETDQNGRYSKSKHKHEPKPKNRRPRSKRPRQPSQPREPRQFTQQLESLVPPEQTEALPTTVYSTFFELLHTAITNYKEKTHPALQGSSRIAQALRLVSEAPAFRHLLQIFYSPNQPTTPEQLTHNQETPFSLSLDLITAILAIMQDISLFNEEETENSSNSHLENILQRIQEFYEKQPRCTRSHNPEDDCTPTILFTLTQKNPHLGIYILWPHRTPSFNKHKPYISYLVTGFRVYPYPRTIKGQERDSTLNIDTRIIFGQAALKIRTFLLHANHANSNHEKSRLASSLLSELAELTYYNLAGQLFELATQQELDISAHSTSAQQRILHAIATKYHFTPRQPTDFIIDPPNDFYNSAHYFIQQVQNRISNIAQILQQQRRKSKKRPVPYVNILIANNPKIKKERR